MREVARDVYQWSEFSDEKQLNFNGHFVVSPKERILVDPPPMPAADADFIRERGGVSFILITNRDHVRDAAACRDHFNAKILVPEQDAPLIDISTDGTFTDRDRLPGGLLVVQIPYSKTPGESALLLERNGGVLILGDALIGKPPGSLNLLPADKFPDYGKARASLKLLMGYAFDTVLVGDGESILVGGKDAVKRTIAGG